MKKFHLSNSGVNRNENFDQTRRLYKSIFDGIHHLDSELAYTKTCADLFTRQLVTQRMKLRDYCERLMFLDPVSYGRKAEELLWRKGYYETFAHAKRQKPGTNWSPLEKAYLQAHLLSGIGQYHNIILRLQAEFSVDLRGMVDFTLLVHDEGLKKNHVTVIQKCNKNHSSASCNAKQNGTDDGASALDWAGQAIHRCLLYLGDLSRYLIDLFPNWDTGLATRYYYQALSVRPNAGMPHNQLGTLSSSKNYNLDAVYHYMRCICSLESFEGTEGNLASVMERNARILEYEKSSGDSPLVKQCITQFLYIAGVLFFDKVPKQDMATLVDGLLSCMKQCMAEEIPKHIMQEPQTLEDVILSEDRQPDSLNDELLFKMFVVSLLCIQRCNEKGFDKTGAEVLCLSLTSILMQLCLNKFTSNLPSPTPAKPKSRKKLHNKRRRRLRHRTSVSSEESDTERVEVLNSDASVSEEELIYDENSSLSSEDENNCAKTNGFSQCNGKELNGDSKFVSGKNGINSVISSNGFVNGCVGSQSPSVISHPCFKFVNQLCTSGFLFQTVKVCCDWLFCNMHIFSSCIESTRPLLLNFVALLNHLQQIPFESDKTSNLQNGDVLKTAIENEFDKIPLSEDIELRSLTVLQPVCVSMNWDYQKTKFLDLDLQSTIRIVRVLKFGKKLAKTEDIAVDFDEETRWFSCEKLETISNGENTQAQVENDGTARGKLMQNMGQAWLRAEVRNLESKTEQRSSPLPPFLIIDCDALINFCPLVKQFVNSKKFIVLIPSVVVQMLDELKRTSGKVRDTIRWLEMQLKNGNRFLQAQLSHEREAIPMIKYPKKKDKEAWTFFQVLECCYYLSKQNSKDTSNLITLVTGSTAGSCNFNSISTVKLAGVNIEHIEIFHGKWKNSCKSHG